MRVGVDTFTLRDLPLSELEALDYAKARGLAGVQSWSAHDGDDPEALARAKDYRAKADSLGLYTSVGCHCPNPNVGDMPRGERLAKMTKQIANAAACGWHDLHTYAGGPEARWNSPIPWGQHLADTKAFFRELAPVLLAHGSRVNLEPKGGLTTFDAVEIIEDVGPDVAGVCLDVANVLCFAEDPVAAARRVAPYTRDTHCKDAIIYFCPAGLRRQVRPPGAGVCDWEKILPILAEHSPGLRLSIEDHKWLYDVPIFTGAWHATVGGLSREELAMTVGLAWRTQQRLAAGELPDPDEYEKIPHVSEVESRLAAGRDYLNGLIHTLGLPTD
ncbi:MAG: sugar phosphate isomerase/epimerase [Planctomycetota bacterium]|nr:sugar phosphate isomerase/epimerase [Planctomycetota bacterium]